ncbi:MAG: HAD family hydrolase [Planctomycetota bacterium]|jgi:HAD superfamily hydrolase (TIGR01509 family)
MSRLYGLIFDVDGVIADTEAINARITIRVFAELFGLDNVVREDFDVGIGRAAEEYVKAGAGAHGIEPTDEQVQKATRVRQEYFLQVLSYESLHPFPGVLELMAEAMKNESFRLAIATSGTLEKSRGVLNAAKVPYEEMIYVNGNDVTHKKPCPELFLLAAERMTIDPADCVVIEDSPNGIQAAKAAGSRCIAVTNTFTAENLAEADLICYSLDEITLETITELIEYRA